MGRVLAVSWRPILIVILFTFLVGMAIVFEPTFVQGKSITFRLSVLLLYTWLVAFPCSFWIAYGFGLPKVDGEDSCR